MSSTRSETPKDFLPQLCTPPAEEDMDDTYRYKGYLYNLREPRYPMTGPIGFKPNGKHYPLKSSLIKGKPVMPTTPATGFLHGSPTIGQYTDEERREKKFNLKLMEKTSADLRKDYRQQLERQRFMKDHQKHKQIESLIKKKEKEDDLKLLNSYNPFGKPGYGAPRGSGKENLSITNAITSKDGVGILQDKMTKEATPPKRPKNKLKIQRYEDDRMRRYRVDRFTANKYKQELDALIDVKKQQEEIVQGIDRKREDEMVNYDPFGKPGAGAPNRDEQGKPSTRRSISLSYVNHPLDAKNIVQKRQRLFKQAQGNIKMSRKHHFSSPEKFPEDNTTNQKDNPWLKLGQLPAKREGIRFPRTGDHGVYEFVDADIESEIFPRKHIGGGGEPLVGDTGEKRTKRVGLLTTIHGARRTENITKVATPENVRDHGRNSPWGRPGAGAPLKDDNGEIVKNTKGRIQYEAKGYSQAEAETIERAKKVYRDDLKEGIDQQRQIRNQEKDYMRLPPGDVPSWFSKGKVGRPKRDPVTGIIVPQKRIMSDVTAQKFNSDRPRDAEKYYQDLQRMADERYRKRVEERQKILQQEIKHTKAFSAFFDRPGHGAPHEKGTARRKFSNNAIMAQEQIGTVVPAVNQIATLNSVLNLPPKRVIEQTASVESFNESQEDRQDKKNNVCKECPQKLSKQDSVRNYLHELAEGDIKQRHVPARRTASFPSAGLPSLMVSTNYKGTSGLRALIENRERPNVKIIQPFPYQVVAPWAIDA
ncbi:uncharacterized protein LOC100181873 isoform X2 [Ciona intestinalis]